MLNLRMTIASALLGLLAIPAAAAEPNNWGQWRGPNFNGSTAATGLPDQVSAESALWSTPIPGHSNGTPIVWDDKVFVTSQTKPAGKLTAFCLSRKDGKILWQNEVGLAAASKPTNDLATCSPVTDGKRVIFLFGS